MEGGEAVANRLAKENSPYLLQHAANPVDWFPWGEEAFEAAQKQDKPVFLSIGYSTCHWCHVMGRESFEDPEVAALINDVFIPVKVDREERPDVDWVYMTVCRMLTGSGGWPLTIVMTPDRKPFFAGTYLPPETRFERIGVTELTLKIKDIWSGRRSEAEEAGTRIISALQDSESPDPDESGPVRRLDRAVLGRAFRQVAGRFDHAHGGFGTAPKFPAPHNLLFLLRHWYRTGDERVLALVEKTLGAMRRGGIFDQVGFGFHRYSTDAKWLLPHFEKMLYDQALLTEAYAEAYQATGKEEYARTVRETLSYVLRDLADPEGGFHSAEDADSEGREGKFYVWTLDQLEEVLGRSEAAFAAQVFNVLESGNFKEEASGEVTGENVLHLSPDEAVTARGLGLDRATLAEALETVRLKLFGAREKRVRPAKDDKILTDWNGLMIAALAKAGRVLREEKYLRAAERAADFILDRLRDKKGRLLHSFRNKAAIPAFADDYAFFIHGLIELYQAAYDPDRLALALELNDDFLARFWDREGGGFFFTPEESDELPLRRKEASDGALPSANSMGLTNLLRLAGLTGREDLAARAADLVRAFGPDVSQAPAAHTRFLSGPAPTLGPGSEAVVAGRTDDPATANMLAFLAGSFLPHTVVLFLPEGEEGRQIRELAPFTAGMSAPEGEAGVYVCRNGVCLNPVTDPDEILELLKPPRR